ncbi:MAG: hypothetical protein IIY12_05025 [Clostridia bacterium]|nr:hypothetical protein [Clostridia bacterium]MBQ1965869.1 hypothetical protein [Clostridia bacterium]MBQ5743021.1 hypothetical protein [Clostridia bacterium]
MSKKTGTILGVILGIIAFVGVVALLCYIFRDKLRMLIGFKDDCDCDCCDCDEDDCGYFEVADGCDCCDDSAAE